MPPTRKLLVAIVAGIVLAGAPVIAFDVWLEGLIQRHEHEEIEHVARRAVALAEERVNRVIAALNALADRGVDSCSPSHIEALRQAMFATMPAKEIAIVSRDGRTLCTDIGEQPEPRILVSSEPASADRQVLLDVVRLGGRTERWIRIRRLDAVGGNGLAALIPAELLDARAVASERGQLPIHVRVATRGGTAIGGDLPPGPVVEDASLLTSVAASQSLPLKVAVSSARSGLETSQQNLRAAASVVSGLIAILIFIVALLLPRRELDNPVAELERALQAGEFVPYYQPIVDIRTGRLRGAEVLVRWRRPDGSMASPATFIPLAESSGLIVELTRVLMRKVCQEIGPALGRRPHLKIAFNLAARHFADEEIVRDVRQIFGKSQLRFSQVVLEVTERQPIDNLTGTRRVVAALQGFGVRIAIDDVGTGHSGLSYMLKLGVDIIKIDKMFIDSIGTDRNSHTIVETLIDLARNMRMDIIAEGVESFEQVVALRELGIRAAQGFVFAPPLPTGSFLQLLDAIDPLEADAEVPAAAAAALA